MLCLCAQLGMPILNVLSNHDQRHQQKLDQLQKLSGKPFDEAYNKDEVQNHESTITLLQQYAQNGDNSDLKQWASKVLLEMKQHLTNAEKLK